MEDSKKRTNVSRRPQAAAEEMRPMLPKVAAPPRSGQLTLPPRLHFGGGKGDDDKHKYRVSLPTNMILVLAVVFVIVPLLIFFYKEVHIHEDHHYPHYKSEKFINVDTHDVMSHFRDNHHHQSSRSHSSSNSTKQGMDPPVSSSAEGGLADDLQQQEQAIVGNVTNTHNLEVEANEKVESASVQVASSPDERRRHLRHSTT
jgi:hypothetical protein